MLEERVCAVTDVPPGEARRFELGNTAITLVRLDDAWYAIGDRCTHDNISLAEGEVNAEEREIECWKHGSCFSLETGEPVTLPATKSEPVYDVRIDGDDVYVVMG